MSKRTIVLIVILVIITIGLLSLAFIPLSKNNQSTPVTTQPTIPSVAKDVVLSFTPEVVQVSKIATASASASASAIAVTIQSGTNKVTAVQLEVSYDPKVLTNVKVTPGTFFATPNIFFNTVDGTNGKISYAVGVSPSGQAVSGNGEVATITFTPIAAASIISSPLSFTNKTLVTGEGSIESVLKETKNAVVVFPQQ